MSKLYIIRGEYQPNSAPFNRLLSFLNVFEKLGLDTELVFLFPNWENTKPQLSYKHIKITYLYESIKLFHNRIIAKSCSFFLIKSLIRKISDRDVVLALGANGLLLKKLNKFTNARVIHEVTEHPDVLDWRMQRIKKNYIEGTKCVDALFVISTALKEYFIGIGIPAEKITIVNMTVDPTRFDNIQKDNSTDKYIAYCGTASNNKDGVNKLIEAFGLVAKKHEDVRLYIIGKTPSASDESGNLQLIEKLGLKERIVFTGVVPAEKMPQLLTNATVLALARPNNLQAQNGFPTKLGEYLLTANPVVVTKVGDIPLFLKDGESALLAEPDNTQEFADKLCWALEHPTESMTIGEKGRDVAMSNFNSNIEATKIIKIILG